MRNISYLSSLNCSQRLYALFLSLALAVGERETLKALTIWSASAATWGGKPSPPLRSTSLNCLQRLYTLFLSLALAVGERETLKALTIWLASAATWGGKPSPPLRSTSLSSLQRLLTTFAERGTLKVSSILVVFKMERKWFR